MNHRPVEVTIILAAKNEEHSLCKLLPSLNRVLREIDVSYEILLVDGHSDDGTARVASAGGARVLKQTVPGYGAAIRLGILSAQGDWITVLDSDGSHPVELIPVLLQNRQRYDVVVASRMHNDALDQRSGARKYLTIVINWCFRLAFPGPIRDFTGAYRLYRRECLTFELYAKHFDIQPEIAINCQDSGLNILEVPYTFSERFRGAS